MKSSSPLARLPLVQLPPSPLRAPPRLVSLTSADLVEEPCTKRPSVAPPLPPKLAAPRRSERVPKACRAVGKSVSEILSSARREIDFASDGLSAARSCLDALHRLIPCRVSVVHWYDEAKRAFVVVHARGDAAESMVLERSSHDDPLLRIAMAKSEPFAWDDLRRAPVTRLARFSGLDGVVTVLVCPLVSEARWLGAIELVDPVDRAAFRSQDIANARCVADRYAQLSKSLNLSVDVGKVARFASRSLAIG